MPDDPRAILKAAGVECAEVEVWSEWHNRHTPNRKLPDAAILALSRLVARYKWIAEHPDRQPHVECVPGVIKERPAPLTEADVLRIVASMAARSVSK